MSLTLILASALALAAAEPPAQTPPPPEPANSETDVFGRDTITAMADFRLVAANGEPSFTDGGYGKTRFGGTATGAYKAQLVPAEVDLVWNPRFTGSLSANISAAWQRDHDHPVDLIEAFVNWLPPQRGSLGFSARAGLMWPEISLEHSTGGAWSVVNTITPSAINAWVGEEVKVIGAEATAHASLGQHQLALTGGVFGFNDTSGTLISFRGWALHDEKATAFGHFPLPPLNPFIRLLQENRTRSTIDLDHQPGFYARVEWRPPVPVALSLFYYDNRGDPHSFTPNGQWGWRTRFLNAGLNADLGPSTTLLAQGMAGSTIMGFETAGVPWVHTNFRATFAALTHRLSDKLAITGRAEAFGTREHGSEMSPLDSEDGWSLTAASRWTISPHVTLLAEALNVRSHRGGRGFVGVPTFPVNRVFEAQTVFQLALRVRL